MMRYLFIIIFISSWSYSQEAQLQFEQANQLYREGKYREAEGMYEKIYKNGFDSPYLHYNMGNSFFKLNDIPRAILSYERAKRLSPNDEDILYNLRLANLRIVDKIEPLPKLFFVNWWDSFVNIMSSSNWALVIISALWIMGVSVLCMIGMRRITLQRIFFFLSIAAFIFSTLAFLSMYQRLSVENNESDAIIISEVISVKSAPDDKSTDLFVLHEGIKVEILDQVEKWNKIRLPDGKMGWVQENAFEKI